MNKEAWKIQDFFHRHRSQVYSTFLYLDTWFGQVKKKKDST